MSAPPLSMYIIDGGDITTLKQQPDLNNHPTEEKHSNEHDYVKNKIRRNPNTDISQVRLTIEGRNICPCCPKP